MSFTLLPIRKSEIDTMPSTDSYASHIAPLPSAAKGLEMTTETAGLQEIAEKHITKGIGRMRDHIFKEGKGLRVLTTVRLHAARTTPANIVGRETIARFHFGYRSHFPRTLSPRRHGRYHCPSAIHHSCPMRHCPLGALYPIGGELDPHDARSFLRLVFLLELWIGSCRGGYQGGQEQDQEEQHYRHGFVLPRPNFRCRRFDSIKDHLLQGYRTSHGERERDYQGPNSDS